MEFSEILLNVGIRHLVAVPDSLGSKLINVDSLKRHNIQYIQTLNEISAVAISSGLNLTGEKTICLIENTGIRFACDIISRFELAHGIHNIYLLSYRGTLGEENWWGVFHDSITLDIIDHLLMKIEKVDSGNELEKALNRAIQSFRTEQVSVVILLTYDFFEEL